MSLTRCSSVKFFLFTITANNLTIEIMTKNDLKASDRSSKNADSKNNVRLRIQLSEGKTAEEDELEDSGGLSLVTQDEDQPRIF